MTWDDERPAPPKGPLIGESLETLSVGELEARIKALEAEIARVRAELERKRAHESAASALFRKPGG